MCYFTPRHGTILVDHSDYAFIYLATYSAFYIFLYILHNLKFVSLFESLPVVFYEMKNLVDSQHYDNYHQIPCSLSSSLQQIINIILS